MIPDSALAGDVDSVKLDGVDFRTTTVTFSSNDAYNGSSKRNGIYTANTWPDEYKMNDDVNKASASVTRKNQCENNIARHLDYGFTMPNGTYSIEIGLQCFRRWLVYHQVCVCTEISTSNR